MVVFCSTYSFALLLFLEYKVFFLAHLPCRLNLNEVNLCSLDHRWTSTSRVTYRSSNEIREFLETSFNISLVLD